MLHYLCYDHDIAVLTQLMESRWATALDFAARNDAGETCVECSARLCNEANGRTKADAMMCHQVLTVSASKGKDDEERE